MRLTRSILALIVLATAILGSGCARYWRNRGRDALNLMDIGISVNNTWKPQFSCYIDFFNLTPFGYGHLDCKELGIGNRQAGWIDYQNHSWGVLGYGHERHGHGRFNPLDLEVARPEQKDLTERPMFTNGLGGAFAGDHRPPRIQFIECNRSFHIGWIGIQHTMRPAAILDFILGWTTFDLLGDDDLPPPPKKTCEKALEETPETTPEMTSEAEASQEEMSEDETSEETSEETPEKTLEETPERASDETADETPAEP
ncbi:hypothetical protein JW916_01770 [Candidatus Sumerlaeota bacterium]|nr:hypothetical protein [Candidatus Sumerlaeota bacterium]